jgi:exopolysaccharide biosynthesis polyprenyl glycosylphosphotransferase
MASVNQLTEAAFPASAEGADEHRTRLAHWISRIPPAWWPYLLLFSDIVLILVAFVGAYYLRYQLQLFRTVDPVFQVTLVTYAPFIIALMVVLPIAFRLSGVYPYRRGRSLIEEVYAIATASTAGLVVLIAVSLLFSPLLYSRLIFLYTAFWVTVFLGISRFIIQEMGIWLARQGVAVERVMLIGAGDVGRMVMRTVAARPDYGLKLIGFLDDNPAKNNDIGPFRALGPVDSLDEVLETEPVDTVVVCLPWQSHRMIQRILRVCEQRNVRAQVVPDLFQLTKNQVKVQELNGIPLLSVRDVSIRGWNLLLKRGVDLFLTALSAVVVLPLSLLIALAIWLEDRGPVIYSQIRVGRDGKLFRCYKFRSMVEGAEAMREELSAQNHATGPLFKLRDDPRCTRVGRFLRRFSLDELPQLINVVRGEMSLVGPRPNLPEEVEQYQEWHKRRLTVRPGITGLWQVSGRSDLTFDEMVLLDIYYVENWNLALDINILLRSLPAVLRARGAY